MVWKNVNGRFGDFFHNLFRTWRAHLPQDEIAVNKRHMTMEIALTMKSSGQEILAHFQCTDEWLVFYKPGNRALMVASVYAVSGFRAVQPPCHRIARFCKIR